MLRKVFDYIRKQLFNLSFFHLPLLWYVFLNGIYAALEKNIYLMVALIISICSLVFIILMKRLLYKRQKKKLIFFQNFAIIFSNIAIVCFQFVESNHSNSYFRLANSIYGEIVFLHTIKIKNIKYLYIFFEIFYLTVSQCFSNQEIIFLSLMKISLLIIFSKNNSINNQYRSNFMAKKINFYKGEMESNFNYEINLKVDKHFNLHSYDENLENISFSIEECLNRLKNLDFLLLREFSHLPSAEEYSQCFISEEYIKKKKENFEGFFREICQNDGKNLFFVGDVVFFGELEHDLITIYKISNIIIIKIKKDECYSQFSKAIRINNCYSKAISFVAHELLHNKHASDSRSTNRSSTIKKIDNSSKYFIKISLEHGK